MVSQNFVISMLGLALILFAAALVLYASLMSTILSLGTTTTIGGSQTTVALAAQSTSGSVTTVAPVTLPNCLVNGFSRIDQSSTTCYKVSDYNFVMTMPMMPPQACSSGSVLAKVDTPAENARVQAFIDSLTFRGFFYVGVTKGITGWRGSGSIDLTFEKTFFDVDQFGKFGPSVYMKTGGNKFWYQNNGYQYKNEGFNIICQMDN